MPSKGRVRIYNHNCAIAIFCGWLDCALTNTFRTPLWPHAVLQPGKVTKQTNRKTKEKAIPKNTLCRSGDFEKKKSTSVVCYVSSNLHALLGLIVRRSHLLAGKETTRSLRVHMERNPGRVSRELQQSSIPFACISSSKAPNLLFGQMHSMRENGLECCQTR